MIHHQDDHLTVHIGDCRDVLATLPADSVHCVVTSPPYWGLRDYGVAGALGLEPTPEAFITSMVEVFREVRRVLRRDGTLWLNMGDSYAGARSEGGGTMAGFNDRYFGRETDGGKQAVTDTSKPARPAVAGLKPKDLVGMPWRLAFALQADGWYLRSDIIWAKPNPMPESVTDRPTKSHEYVFLLTKSARYYYDAEAVREGRSEKSWNNGGSYRGGTKPAPKGVPAGAKNPGSYARSAVDMLSGDVTERNLRSVWQIATEPYPNVKLDRAPGQRDDDDDSGRTVSPDCPVHGDQRHRASKAGRDAPLDVSGPDRSPDSDPRPEPAPLHVPVPIDLLHGVATVPDSSDSASLVYGPTATDRSSESHRTARAPLTSPHGTDDGGLWFRTGHSEPGADPDASDGRTPESSTAAGSFGDGTPTNLVERMPPRTTCTCTSWESVSHFAVFPQKLVEPCIKAGTSERGVCPGCGAPWVREVDVAYGLAADGHRHQRRTIVADGAGRGARGTSAYVDSRGEVLTRQGVTTGWRSSCTCTEVNDGPAMDVLGVADALPTRVLGGGPRDGSSDGEISEQDTGRPEHSGRAALDPVPATVLDPFAGSGTTALVANRLGRRAILIDLSADYIDQAMLRNQQHPLGLIG